MTSITEVVTDNDCPICYDPISTKNNNCVTPCGHEFCFKCLMLSIARNNKCPCCRAPLQEESELLINNISGSDSDSGSETDDDYDTDDEDDDDSEIKVDCSIENVTKAIQLSGFSMMDLISLLIHRYPGDNPEYTNEKCDTLHDKFYAIVEELDEAAISEFNERENMANEDERNIPRIVGVNLLNAFNAVGLLYEPFVNSDDEVFVEPSGEYSFI